MEDNQEEVVDTGTTEEGVDLTDVDIMSNGQTVDTTEEVAQEDGESTEDVETNEEKETEEDPEEQLQEDINKQKQADEDTKKLLTDKGVNFDALLNTYTENGSLSDEQYKQLDEAGFPRTVVDAYIAGSEAQADKFADTVMSFVGSKEDFGKMTKFVQAQGDASVNAFNKVMETADLGTIKMFVGGIKAQMDAKYGTKNPTILGGGTTVQAGGFADQGEMVKAMSDPRYGRDAKYTKSVEKRVAGSKFFG